MIFWGGLNSLVSSLSFGRPKTSAKGTTNIFIILSPYLYWRWPFWQSMFSANIFPTNQGLYRLTIYFSTRSLAVSITRLHATRMCARQLCILFYDKIQSSEGLRHLHVLYLFSHFKIAQQTSTLRMMPFTHTIPLQIVISFLRPLNLYRIVVI